MLSRLCESEPSRLTSGARSDSSTSGDLYFPERAQTQLRLPLIVLISPLCASMRNGWARRQRGSVLVEKRWWNTAAQALSSGWEKSGNASRSRPGATIALATNVAADRLTT